LNAASRELWIGFAAALGVVVMWTSFQLISRAGVQSTLTPYDLTSLRFGIGAIVMLPFALRLGLGNLTLGRALVLAALAGPGFALFAYSGFTFAPAAHGGAILSGTVSMFAAVFGWIVLRERLSMLQASGLSILLGGVALLAGDAFGDGPPDQWIGDLMFLTGAASWALFAVLARKWHAGAVRVTALTAVFSALAFIPVHIALLPSNLTTTPWLEVAGQGFYQGFLSMVVSMLLFTRAVQALGSTLTGVIAAAVPAVATICAWLMLAEPVSDLTLAGVVAVTVGLLGAAIGSELARRRFAIAAAR
jgi:drug/metabolite transporter (DMT)-like permease